VDVELDRHGGSPGESLERGLRVRRGRGSPDGSPARSKRSPTWAPNRKDRYGREGDASTPDVARADIDQRVRLGPRGSSRAPPSGSRIHGDSVLIGNPGPERLATA
jgi:hypothetical protein